MDFEVYHRNKETLKSLKPHQQICEVIILNVNENQLLQRETKVLDELIFSFMCKFVHVIRVNISAIRSL